MTKKKLPGWTQALIFFTLAIFSVWVVVVTFMSVIARPTHTWDIEPPVQEDDEIQFISGTEYKPGQEGQVIVMIVDVSGDVVTSNYACNFSILYPDKASFVSGNFTNTSSSIGALWTNFTVPQTEGVYEYAATCEKPGKTVVAAKSFHVTRQRIRAVIPK